MSVAVHNIVHMFLSPPFFPLRIPLPSNDTASVYPQNLASDPAAVLPPQQTNSCSNLVGASNAVEGVLICKLAFFSSTAF